MLIIPEANNAITITLSDGISYRLHHSVHGKNDVLFISALHECKGHLQLEDWSNIPIRQVGTAHSLAIKFIKDGE